MARLFGTDGVRGIANEYLTPELAYDIGKAAGYVLGNEIACQPCGHCHAKFDGSVHPDRHPVPRHAVGEA